MKIFSIAILILSVGIAELPAQEIPIMYEGKMFAALSVPNAEETSGWYEKIFGLSLLKEIRTPDGKIHVRIISDNNLMLEIIQNAESRSGKEFGIDTASKIHGYFKIGIYVRNLSALESSLKEAGVEIRRAFEDKDLGVRSVLIADLNGQLIQFFQKV